MTSNEPIPQRGEVWIITFDPAVGSEIQKTRPAVVVSSDSVGRLLTKLVVPLTEWKPGYTGHSWHIRVHPNTVNGLTKESAADALQLRCISVQRCQKRIGRLSESQMKEIAAVIASVVEFK